MYNYLIVGLGAAVGGMMRYWLSGIAHQAMGMSFPYGTLTVNMIGSFVLGLILFSTEFTDFISPTVRIFLATGLCGGLTTFSTFSYETISLIKDSEFFYAGMNVLLNVLLTLVMVVISYFIVKYFFGN
jgi:CrcB protein